MSLTPSETSSPAVLNSVLAGDTVNGTSTPPLTTFDASVFKKYLLALLPPVLGADVNDLNESLFDEGFDEGILRFAAEGSTVIYVSKTRADSEGVVAWCLLRGLGSLNSGPLY